MSRAAFPAFDASDPFPLLSHPVATSEARAHARAADAWLGLRVDGVEALLEARGAARDARAAGHEIWLERGADVFLTPYIELRAMLERAALPNGALVVDLGAGYGRFGFVLARHRPDAIFKGYEIVSERAAEANRALACQGCTRAHVETVDVSSPAFRMPPAEMYFIYDFGARPAIQGSLVALRSIAQSKAIVVIGRGRASRDAIERQHPWLSQVVEPEHGANWSLYRSAIEGSTNG